MSFLKPWHAPRCKSVYIRSFMSWMPVSARTYLLSKCLLWPMINPRVSFKIAWQPIVAPCWSTSRGASSSRQVTRCATQSPVSQRVNKSPSGLHPGCTSTRIRHVSLPSTGDWSVNLEPFEPTNRRRVQAIRSEKTNMDAGMKRQQLWGPTNET